jgi:hypothetical protein
LSSPSQQVSESQPGTTELVVEPDAEVVQSYPCRQASPQTLKLMVMGPLSPETKGVEEYVVDALHNLTYSGHPLPQALGPAPLAAMALGWINNPRPVALLPPLMVLSTLKTLE